MKNTYLMRRCAVMAICVALLGQAAYAAPMDVATQGTGAATTQAAAAQAVKTVTIGTVNASVLNVRANPGTDQQLIGKVYSGESVIIGASQNGWHYIATSKVVGWVSGEYIAGVVSITEAEYQAQLAAGASVAANAAAFSKQLVGIAYRAGGGGPNAFDCSGLVKYAYNSVGVQVPRSSSEWASYGTTVAQADIKPGDVLCFNIGGRISHVGIYVGNGQFVHAATAQRGVVYDSIYAGYYGPKLVRIARIV